MTGQGGCRGEAKGGRRERQGKRMTEDVGVHLGLGVGGMAGWA